MYDRVGVGWDVCVLPMSCEVMEERREEAEEAGKEWGSSRRDGTPVVMPNLDPLSERAVTSFELSLIYLVTTSPLLFLPLGAVFIAPSKVCIRMELRKKHLCGLFDAMHVLSRKR